MGNKILVFGATGQQGFAVAHRLVNNTFRVRAFTRNQKSDRARHLNALGAELFEGDIFNEKDVRKAMQGAYGLFLVLPPEWNPSIESDEKEWHTAKMILDIAAENKVKHIVYSSVMGSELQEPFRPLFKYTIEQYLKNLGPKYTILKPAAFYENFYMPQYGLANHSVYNPLPADMKLPFISVEDIGVFANLAFRNPEAYTNRSLNITGEKLTASEIAQVFSEKLDVTITAVQLPLEMIQAQNTLLGQFMSELHEKGYPEIHVEEYKQLHPELISLREWVDEYAITQLKAIVGK